MTRIDEYLRYHKESARVGDIDPSYSMLRYVCDRYELNLEQRYWMAFLYAMSYCGPCAFYWYHEFPDYENCDVDRMNRWWYGGGREASLCQTDRRWVRSSNQFVPAFQSYRAALAGKTQHEHFFWFQLNYGTPEKRYDALYEWASQLYSFGQFALFLYLEALHVVTPIDLEPTDLDLSKAWSCRYGLYYTYGLDNLIGARESPTPSHLVKITDEKWRELRVTLAQLENPPTVWQTETLLCAFRKWSEGKRYVGSYIDRQGLEIAKMEEKVPRGVHWKVLWQYREETFEERYLAEKHSSLSARGLSREWKRYVIDRTQHVLDGGEL